MDKLEGHMNTVFDPLTLVILMAALVVGLVLRGTLGKRTGYENPSSPFGLSTPEDGIEDRQRARQEEKEDDTPPPPVWLGVAEEGSFLARTLILAQEKDPDFSPKDFLEGASSAYEMVLEAFAKEDEDTLKDLVSAEVFNSFEAAISARKAQGQTLHYHLVSLDEATISDATLDGDRLRMTVRFAALVLTTTHDRDGALLSGDPKHPKTTRDLWTFERDLCSPDPHWCVVETQAP